MTSLYRIDSLSGLVSPEIGRALAAHAAIVPPGEAIVELGSFRGKSTCYLAAGAKEGLGARVWAVDPWDLPGNVTGRFGFAEPSTREAFDVQVRAAGLTSWVTPVQAFSTEAAAFWPGPPIGLLFVDGDHSTDAVRADFIAWRPYLVDGATVIFDDYLSPTSTGVKPAVDSLGLGELHVEAEWIAVGTFRG